MPRRIGDVAARTARTGVTKLAIAEIVDKSGRWLPARDVTSR